MLGRRVNAPITVDGVHDLAAVSGYTHRPGIVLVAKVESARDIEVVAGALDTGGQAAVIYALTETPRAIDRLPAIVRADRLDGLLFGAARNTLARPGKVRRRVPSSSAENTQPVWSVCRWVNATVSMSSGDLPSRASVSSSAPLSAAPISFANVSAPGPVSISNARPARSTSRPPTDIGTRPVASSSPALPYQCPPGTEGKKAPVKAITPSTT